MFCYGRKGQRDAAGVGAPDPGPAGATGGRVRAAPAAGRGSCPGRAWQQGGFSLAELMVTLAVGAILLVLAVPSFRNYILDTKLVSESNALIASLNLARNTAITEVTPVSVCGSGDGGTCTGGKQWSGWLVFVDEGSDGNYDAGDRLVQVHQASSGVTIYAGAPSIRFSSLGALAE